MEGQGEEEVEARFDLEGRGDFETAEVVEGVREAGEEGESVRLEMLEKEMEEVGEGG